ncbi:DNA methylase [Ruminococcus sp.]|uniref:Y-family DNA polymerase n=1 Tax=Ruminococcus sp. TaxID=41978 RepID=UPI0025ED74F6|nr:DNA methylase [Ruminococcus sp.]MBQ8968018.1 DNA methylase [Ruminococcus sp.]
MDRIYVAIDLKSFYASVECVERGLDPLDANLVVADKSRTEKTICLAVTPALKAYGISGRARLFEVVESVKSINDERRAKLKGRAFSGSSFSDKELKAHGELELDYVIAPPQMARYIEISSEIYGIYLKYVAPEDIFAYSIDEVFIDATGYLTTYGLSPHDFVAMLVRDVLNATGITATAGIGTNLYLCKIAMDIVAKHMPADKYGVRIAFLDEQLYREKLWKHRPITDFWRVGGGIAKRLATMGIFTMGDIARHSLDRFHIRNIYKSLGKNAELLIDHAWGIEPTTIADVKAYRPDNNSLSSGQVLTKPTEYKDTRLIVWEMADALSLDLADKGVVTDQLTLTIGYDRDSLAGGNYSGEIVKDHYGRAVPKHSHGTVNLPRHTSSSKQIVDAVMELFDSIADPTLYSRRLTIAACNLVAEDDIPEKERYEQLDLFTIASTLQESEEQEKARQKEKAIQQAMLKIKHRYGKNALLRGTNYLEGGTARERNMTIGGHRA